MNELDLKRLGFFEIETTLTSMDGDIRRFKIFECYKGVFLRIIISIQRDNFIVEHISFGSPKSDELQLELFGTDLSVRNVIERLIAYRETIDPSEALPETF